MCVADQDTNLLRQHYMVKSQKMFMFSPVNIGKVLVLSTYITHISTKVLSTYITHISINAALLKEDLEFILI